MGQFWPRNQLLLRAQYRGVPSAATSAHAQHAVSGVREGQVMPDPRKQMPWRRCASRRSNAVFGATASGLGPYDRQPRIRLCPFRQIAGGNRHDADAEGSRFAHDAGRAFFG